MPSGGRIGATILLGIVAFGSGVVVRRATVAWAGGLTVIGAGTIATWNQLGELPTWVWLLGGGIGLLGLAMLVERRTSEGTTPASDSAADRSVGAHD